MNRKLFLSIILLLLINFAYPIVPANVDRQTLALGQSFTLTIDTSNAKGSPELNVLQQNFQILGNSSSSQTSIINGRISSQTMVAITLVPKNIGHQTIPAIMIGNDSTTPITINVTPQTANNDISSTNIKNDKVFLVASIAKPTTYVDVPITYSIKLYFSIPLANISMPQINIKNVKLEPDGKSIQYQATQNKHTYQVLEQKFRLTPNKAGDITIPPTIINGTIVAGDNIHDVFAMTNQIPFTRSSKALVLHVKDIPNSMGNEWLPATGVSVDETWSNTTTDNIKSGQPLTRTITIQARGVNATSIPEYTFASPSGVNSYPDKTNISDMNNNDEIIGRKIFKIVYVPNISGKITFPEKTIKWWDIQTNTMKSIILPEKIYTIIDTQISQNSQSTPIIKINRPVTTVSMNKNIWFYIALIITMIWALTVVIVIILLKNRFKKKSLPSNLIIKSIDNEKKCLKGIYSACKNQNITLLNHYLIQWAMVRWHTNIYTISDIIPLTDNVELNSIIENLNIALYNKADFRQFDQIQVAIKNITMQKEEKPKIKLQDLYPK